MSATATIAGRELRAFFLSPGGYVVAALYLAASGLFFVRHVFAQGEPATLRPVFAFSMLMFVLICPAIAMRSISEELRLGTFEVLMTSPVRSAQIILGKFAAALAFLVVLLAPTLLYVGALEAYGRPDYGELAAGYLGLVLAGAAFLAGGILASTLTASQVVAYLVTFFFWVLVLLVANLLPSADLLPVEARRGAARVLHGLDPMARLGDFAIGLIDSAGIVYFVSVTVVLLVAAVASLEARRWR